MSKEIKEYLLFYAGVALVVIGAAIAILAFFWRAGVQFHHAEFCEEETMAVADKSLKCQTKGQKIEFIEKRDRTWAVCRCPLP